MLKKYAWIVLITAFVLVFWLGKQSGNQNEAPAGASTPSSTAGVQNLPEPVPLPEISSRPAASELPAFLPPEAKTTLDLIASGGPFPNRQDGVVFQNREQRLPKKYRGYYHEYTVETPGLSHRGARRILVSYTPAPADQCPRE